MDRADLGILENPDNTAENGRNMNKINSNSLHEGTRVRVMERVHQTDASYDTETVGVIEAWKDEPTGAWFAHNNSGKLRLQRLKIRKADGEVSTLTIDDRTRIQPVDGDAGRDDRSARTGS